MALHASDGGGSPVPESRDTDERSPSTHLLHDPNTTETSRPTRNFWLTRIVLIGFATVFIACAGALVGLWRLISSENGLVLSISSSHYSWTYGPTAVLVVILSLWRQVDYQCKSMQPWWEMARGPSPASKTVLVDYISPFQPTVCIKAFRSGHYAVFLSIVGFFLLKLIILLSTTLFVVQPTKHVEAITVRYQDQFDAGRMWNTSNYTPALFNWSPFNPSGYQSPDEAATSVWSYIAEINNKAPHTMAHQSISLSNPASYHSTVTYPVEVLVPDVSCEEAAWSPPHPPGITKDFYEFYDLETPDCTARGLTLSSPECGEPWHSPCRTNMLIRDMFFVQCGMWESNIEGKPELAVRFVFTVGDFTATFKDPAGLYDKVRVDKSAAVLCKAAYSLKSTNATQDLSNGQITLEDAPLPSSQPRMLPDLTQYDFASILFANLEATSWSLETVPSTPDTVRVPATFFKILASRDNWSEIEESLLNPSSLGQVATEFLVGVANSFAKTSLLVESLDQKPIEATALVSTNKLHIRRYTLWPMVAGFLLLSCLCLALTCVVSSQSRNLHVPASIASQAAVLANSPSMLAALRHVGPYRWSELRYALQNMQFALLPGKVPSIEASGSSPVLPSSLEKAKKKPWVPQSARLPMVALLFVTPVLLISALEILGRISDKRNGFFSLESSDSVQWTYVVRIASTLLAFATATMFTCLDSTTAILAPFSILRSGSTPADRSLAFNLLGVSPLLVPLHATSRRHFGAAAANIASLLGGLLTVIVSGLWVVGDPVQTYWATEAVAETWDRSWLAGQDTDNGAALALNIMLHGGATRPALIKNDVGVLPTLKLRSSPESSRNLSNTFNTTILRPTMKCSIIPREDIVITEEVYWSDYSDTPTSIETLITLNTTFPPDCSLRSKNATFGQPWNASVSDYTYVGSYLELDIQARLPQQPCPSVGILFGKMKIYYDSQHQQPVESSNLTGLLCSQGIAEIPATITYRGDPVENDIISMELYSDEARPWWNETDGGTSLAFKLSSFFTAGLSVIPIPLWDKRWRFDSFMENVLTSSGDTPTDYFIGPENYDKLTEAVVRNWEEYMVLAIDRNFRSQDAVTTIQGVVTQSIMRISIHGPSKLVLQVLLAIMTVLGLVGYKLVKLRGTLPRNPCSIASTMGFLADSHLCDPDSGVLPKDAAAMSEKELSRSLRGYVFSLGWWDDAGGRSKLAGAGPEDGTSSESRREMEPGETSRFGIDVGHADVLGFCGKNRAGEQLVRRNSLE